MCLPFGEAHREAVEGFLAVESGIGYPTSFLPFRIYESHAQKAWACGREQKSPHNYWFVCPNYYDVTEWPFGEPTKPLVGYFGRICHIKGLDVVVEVARRFPFRTSTSSSADRARTHTQARARISATSLLCMAASEGSF